MQLCSLRFCINSVNSALRSRDRKVFCTLRKAESHKSSSLSPNAYAAVAYSLDRDVWKTPWSSVHSTTGCPAYNTHHSCCICSQASKPDMSWDMNLAHASLALLHTRSTCRPHSTQTNSKPHAVLSAAVVTNRMMPGVGSHTMPAMLAHRYRVLLLDVCLHHR